MSFWPEITQLLPELKAYSRSIADSFEEADDLVNDAIERAARMPGRPEDLAGLRHWMFRVIRNLSIDELRKRRVRREYSLAVSRLSHEVGTRSLGIDDAVLVRRAYEKLKAGEREVLFLVDIMGMTYAEAAAVMEVPNGTVMSRVSRARRALLGLVGGQKTAKASRGS